jgi:isopropylmalate/homocitrate/citramalate synthase
MDALALVDTFGVTSPHAMQFLVRHVKSRINKRLEAHFHMDFAMGVANTIMALAEGVEVMHTTVLGIGERAGNVPMEETAMALLTMYGIDIGLDYGKLTKLAKLVQQRSGIAVPWNKPIVGDMLYNVESGIITSWLKNCGHSDATEVFPYRWEFVGQKPAEAVMGKGSGLDSVKVWLEEAKMTATEDEVAKILAVVKTFSLDHKRLLTKAEFRDIAEDIISPKAKAR